MSIDFFVTFGIMGLLFVRQVVIFRQPNKINYAPLLLGVGAIGSMVHLMLHPDNNNFPLLLRESLLPLFAGLMLFIVMNILQQARRQGYINMQEEHSRKLMEQSERLREYVHRLENNQHLISAKEDSTQHRFSDAFETEQRMLETIQKNQKGFVEKIESILLRQEALFERLEQFTHKEVPDLDSVVHRHIDMLRIAEQDHYNRLVKHFDALGQHPGKHTEQTAAFEQALKRLEVLHEEAGSHIAGAAAAELLKAAETVTGRYAILKSQSESFSTMLSADEKRLHELAEQSELLMKQILICAKSMNEIVTQSERVRELYEPLGALSREVSAIHGDYVASKIELAKLVHQLHDAENGQIETLRREVEMLDRRLNDSIDASLEKLHEHYHIAQKEISGSVRELSARARLQQSYGGEAPTTQEERG